MTDHNDDTAELAAIPGMPDAAAIRAELVRTGGPAYWRPHGRPDGTATDFSAKGELGTKVLEARLALGPGPHGTPYQKALFDYHAKIIELEKEEAGIIDKMGARQGYDPATGQPISANDAQTQVALRERLLATIDQRQRLQSDEGLKGLDRALEAAVREVQEQHRQAYMTAEARRRASASAMEDEIERRAAGFRKTQPRP